MTSSTAARAKTLGFRSLVVLGGAAVAVSALALPSKAAPAPAPGFTSDQVRLLDTRSSAADPGPVQGLQPITVTAPSGSTAELTLTATGATGSGYVTAYPDGSTTNNALPGTSDLNFVTGQTISSTVVVPVPASGVVDVYVAGATTQLIVDQQGYFSGSDLTGGAPTRIADSRTGQGFATTGAQSGTATLTLASGSYTAGKPIALNVSALPSGKGAGYVTAYTGGTTAPSTSTVNYNGVAASNLVLVTPSATGTVSFKVVGVSANLLVDVEADAPTASTIMATSDRIADTRTPLGLPKGPITGAHTLTIPIADAPAGATGVVLNLTSTGSTGGGFITAYPGTTAPTTSELQFAKGQTVAQTVVVPVTSNGTTAATITVAVSGSPSQVVVDTEGYVSAAATD